MQKLYNYSDLAVLLKMDKGNLIRLINKLKLKTYKYRSGSNRNQIVKAIDEEGFEILNDYRNGPSEINDKISYKNEFYLILLPNYTNKRIKLGFTSNIE